MRGNIISLIGSSCGCSQTEAREYLDSEIRYLRELQEADDLREDTDHIGFCLFREFQHGVELVPD
ncbi:hypothetical protein AAH034_17830, partial [Parabacteroides merdae]